MNNKLNELLDKKFRFLTAKEFRDTMMEANLEVFSEMMSEGEIAAEETSRLAWIISRLYGRTLAKLYPDMVDDYNNLMNKED